MNIITLDFETYFDDDYSLKKMTTEAYVRDPRFEAHGVGVKMNDGAPQWLTDSQFRAAACYSEPPWNESIVLCHHAAFDGLILSHHYGIKPARWLDTYSMAQYLFGATRSKALGALAEHYGLAPKSVPYETMKGKRWAALTPGEQQAVADGCLQDIELTWAIFNKMMKGED